MKNQSALEVAMVEYEQYPFVSDFRIEDDFTTNSLISYKTVKVITTVILGIVYTSILN